MKILAGREKRQLSSKYQHLNELEHLISKKYFHPAMEVFATFDIDDNGQINATEFILAESILHQGKKCGNICWGLITFYLRNSYFIFTKCTIYYIHKL